MTHTKIDEISGQKALSFSCGELPAEPAVSARGHEPNGYFWEGVASLLAPDLVERLELDSGGSLFSVWGELADLQMLQSLLEPLVASHDAIDAVITRAKHENFVLGD